MFPRVQFPACPVQLEQQWHDLLLHLTSMDVMYPTHSGQCLRKSFSVEPNVIVSKISKWKVTIIKVNLVRFFTAVVFEDRMQSIQTCMWYIYIFWQIVCDIYVLFFEKTCMWYLLDKIKLWSKTNKEKNIILRWNVKLQGFKLHVIPPFLVWKKTFNREQWIAANNNCKLYTIIEVTRICPSEYLYVGRCQKIFNRRDDLSL